MLPTSTVIVDEGQKEPATVKMELAEAQEEPTLFVSMCEEQTGPKPFVSFVDDQKKPDVVVSMTLGRCLFEAVVRALAVVGYSSSFSWQSTAGVSSMLLWGPRPFSSCHLEFAALAMIHLRSSCPSSFLRQSGRLGLGQGLEVLTKDTIRMAAMLRVGGVGTGLGFGFPKYCFV